MKETLKNEVTPTEEATNAVIDGPPEDMNGIPIPAQLLGENESDEDVPLKKAS